MSGWSSAHSIDSKSRIPPALTRLRRLERDDVLAGVHEVLVLDQKAGDPALHVAHDLVEALHDLDQPDHVAGLHLVALVHVRIRLWAGPPVERPGQRRLDRSLHQLISRLDSPRLSASARSASIASSIETSRKRTVSPTGRNCPIFQKSAWMTVAATTNPPAVGPSG